MGYDHTQKAPMFLLVLIPGILMVVPGMTTALTYPVHRELLA